jgi:hypothetical protein
VALLHRSGFCSIWMRRTIWQFDEKGLGRQALLYF